MSFKETVNYIEDFLNKDYSFYYIDNYKMHDKLCYCKDKMLSDVKTGIEKESNNIDYFEEIVQDVKKILDFFTQSIILNKRDDSFNKFINDFLLLIFNWNKIVNDDEIQQKISINKELLNYHDSMIVTVKVLQELLQEYEKIKHFSPPSFEISRHYLESLEKRLEEE